MNVVENNTIIIIIDERGGEAFSYWKVASIVLLLLVNVEAVFSYRELNIDYYY